MDKVRLGTPWLYDRYLLNVHSWEPGLKSDSPMFNVCNIWVQVWNIPLHWLSKEVGQKIVRAWGGIVDVVIPETGSKEGRYLKLKVMINITKPLPRENQRHEGINTTNGRTMGRRVTGNRKRLLYLEDGADPTKMQPSIGEYDHHRMNQKGRTLWDRMGIMTMV